MECARQRLLSVSHGWLIIFTNQLFIIKSFQFYFLTVKLNLKINGQNKFENLTAKQNFKKYLKI